MSRRLFYVVYLADPLLQAGIDVIRLLANPEEKWPAHVTVRGPYETEPNIPDDVLETEGSELLITGVRDFFSENQNTVYLACHSAALAAVWDKPMFGFSPHITLYDGPSKTFARRLRAELGDAPLAMSCAMTSLARMVSIKGDKSNRLASSLESMGVSWLLGERLTVPALKRLSGTRRLELITNVWRTLRSRYDKMPQRLPSRDFLWRNVNVASMMRADSRQSDTLLDIASRAYLDTHRDASIDRVIADPVRNAAFLRRAWRLGADASEYELNRALLRVRKSGKMGALPTVRRYTVSSAALDEYVWAAEFALRLLQDEQERMTGESVTVDRVLCDPSLSYRFDRLARSIAPGRQAMDYRWAALVIRKNYHRRSSMPSVSPTLFCRGHAKSLSTSEFSRMPGLFLFSTESYSVFAGHASDLQAQLDAIRRVRLRDLPHLFRPSVRSFESLLVHVAPCPNISATEREALRSSMVHQFHPLLNVKLLTAA